MALYPPAGVLTPQPRGARPLFYDSQIFRGNWKSTVTYKAPPNQQIPDAVIYPMEAQVNVYDPNTGEYVLTNGSVPCMWYAKQNNINIAPSLDSTGENWLLIRQMGPMLATQPTLILPPQ